MLTWRDGNSLGMRTAIFRVCRTMHESGSRSGVDDHPLAACRLPLAAGLALSKNNMFRQYNTLAFVIAQHCSRKNQISDATTGACPRDNSPRCEPSAVAQTDVQASLSLHFSSALLEHTYAAPRRTPALSALVVIDHSLRNVSPQGLANEAQVRCQPSTRRHLLTKTAGLSK